MLLLNGGRIIFFLHAQKNGKEMFKSSSNGLMYNAIPVLICVFIQSQEGGCHA